MNKVWRLLISIAVLCLMLSAPVQAATGRLTKESEEAVADLGVSGSGVGWEWAATDSRLALGSAYASKDIYIACDEGDTVQIAYTGYVKADSNGIGINCSGELHLSGSGGVVTVVGDASGAGLGRGRLVVGHAVH